MNDIEVVDENYHLSNPLDYGGPDENEITEDQMLSRQKKKTKKVLMKDVIQQVLSKQIKKENPILSKFKFPLKKTKKEIEEKKKLRDERIAKEERKNRGHYIPKYELDREHENKLKATAMRGVIKLFNAIHEYQKNNPEEDL